MFTDLEFLVRPRSVAVVGASADRGKGPGRIIPLLEEAGYGGTIVPINPRYSELDGRQCYPRLDALSQPVDLVVIMAPASAVVDAISQAADLGVKFVVIMSSGFSEYGEQGEAMQEEITEIARRSGMRIYGPNCPGLLNFKDGLPISFSPRLNIEAWRPGRVAVITQGGAMGRAVIDSMEAHGTPKVNYWFSPGNEADLQASDFLGWLAEDPHTDVVLLIIESFRDGRRFIEAAKRAREAGKLVVVLKVGRSEEGIRATATHTAAIAGADRVVDAALAQSGAIRVDDLDELIDLARILERYGAVAIDNVGVCSLSGGSAALLTDECGSAGLGVEPPTDETVTAMAELLPKLAAVGNPVDLTTEIFAQPELVDEAMRLFVGDERIDAAIMPFPYHLGRINEVMAEKLVAVAAETDKPIIAVGMSEAVLDSPAAQILRRAEVPFIHAATKAVAAVARCSRLAQASVHEEPDVPVRESRIPADLGGALSEEISERLLGGIGIPFAESRIVDGPEAGAAAAASLGYPVVLKAATELVAHKSDAGLVRVGIGSAEELHDAVAEIRRNHRLATGSADVPIKVAKQLDGGVEMMCGIVMDPVFGPVISVGLGGVYAEVFADSAMRVCPIGERTAASMIAESAAAPILRGARGAPPLDIEALASLLSELSRFAVADRDRLAGVDINPVLVRESGAVALDALVVTDARTSASMIDGEERPAHGTATADDQFAYGAQHG